jgi:hypothetical protein
MENWGKILLHAPMETKRKYSKSGCVRELEG